MSVNKYNSATGNLKRYDGVMVDGAPTSGSGNPVSSGGVFTALAGKVDKTDEGYVDISISSIELHSGGYAQKFIDSDIPANHQPYACCWSGNWDEHLTLGIDIDSNNRPSIIILGPGSYTIPSNRTVRVFYRKVEA